MPVPDLNVTLQWLAAAAGGLVIALMVFLTALITKRTRSIKTIDSRTESIDRSVNHQDPEEPRLIERVRNIEANQATFNEKIVGTIDTLAQRISQRDRNDREWRDEFRAQLALLLRRQLEDREKET